MNIDERLQALTETVELLASFHRDTEAQLNKLAAKLDKLADTFAPIGQLVLLHEQRLNDLENRR